MKQSMEGIVSSQRDAERLFKDWATRAGWGPVIGAPATEAKPQAAEPDADKLREEVSALRDRLRSLEERLQKRKADPK